MDEAGLEALTSERLDFRTYEDMMTAFEKRGWFDGLPVALATPDVVAEFILASGRPPNEIIGNIPPSWHSATIEKIAINAVMAGCRAEYMPVVVAAARAMLEERFNLYGLQATTHPAAPMVLVSGPIATRLGINSGEGAFGPGWRANATIGRAMRLILLNIGGARPGVLDLSTQGQPSKYTYCVAENDNETPWELHREHLGFTRADSIVVVAAIENPHNINDHGSYSGEQILTTIAGTMAAAGSNALLLGGTAGEMDPYLFLCPEHAQQLAQDAFARSEIQQFLFEKARVPISKIGSGQLNFLRQRHRANPLYEQLALGDADLTDLPTLARPSDLNIVVVGGAGKHSAYAPSTGTLSLSVSSKL